jgi:hypothetical protein
MRDIRDLLWFMAPHAILFATGGAVKLTFGRVGYLLVTTSSACCT